MIYPRVAQAIPHPTADCGADTPSTVGGAVARMLFLRWWGRRRVPARPGCVHRLGIRTGRTFSDVASDRTLDVRTNLRLAVVTRCTLGKLASEEEPRDHRDAGDHGEDDDGRRHGVNKTLTMLCLVALEGGMGLTGAVDPRSETQAVPVLSSSLGTGAMSELQDDVAGMNEHAGLLPSGRHRYSSLRHAREVVGANEASSSGISSGTTWPAPLKISTVMSSALPCPRVVRATTSLAALARNDGAWLDRRTEVELVPAGSSG